MKKILSFVCVLSLILTFVGCNQAERVSENLSKQADSFNIIRRLTVMSLITNDVMFQMEGKMSVWPKPDRLEIIVEEQKDILYKKHFVHLGDNMTYIVEDLGIGANNVSAHKYTLVYNPKMWIPVGVDSID